MTDRKQEIKSNDKQTFLSPLPDVDMLVFHKFSLATALFIIALIVAVSVPISQSGLTDAGDISYDYIVAGVVLAFSAGIIHAVIEKTNAKQH
jgi:hypothetical protein